jgi:CysZ protein
MKDIIESFRISRKIVFSDKAVFFLCMIPLIIGIVFYIYFGAWFYGSFMERGTALIDQYISKDSWGAFIYYIFYGLVSILLFVIIGYTFNLLVSFVASPFNDMLSSRVEKIMLGQERESLSAGFFSTMKRIFSILWEETKKLIFNLTLNVIAVVLGLFAVTSFLSFMLTGLSLAIQFLDYSWCRHELKLSECRRSLFQNLGAYVFTGLGFAAVVLVPVLNTLSIPFGVVFYTVLWLKKNKKDLIVYSLEG